MFVMEIATRRVYFTGCTANPDEPWMVQMARNLSDAEDGFLRRKKFLVMDRDAKFSEEFRATLQQVGIEAVRLPHRSPNLTPHIERFMRSLKDECLHRLIFFGQKPIQAAAVSFLAHYRRERNHQGLDNRLIDPGEEVGRIAGEVECRERLGGILRYLLPAQSGLTSSDAQRRGAPSQEVSAGYNSIPRHQPKSRTSQPAEARACNLAFSTSTEIAAHSRFQPIKRAAVTGGPSFFTTRGRAYSGSR